MTKITGHSGCDDTPENSLEFLEYACDTKADCVEVDVRYDANHQLVLGHDDASSVSLQQAFTVVKHHPEKKINCDLKQEGLEEVVYACAKEVGVENQLVYSGYVSLGKCAHGQQGFEKVEVYFNIENEVKDKGDLEEGFQKIHEANVKVINMEYHLLDANMIALLCQYHFKASVWTVNDVEGLEKMLCENVVENITTRQLKLALKMKEKAC